MSLDPPTPPAARAWRRWARRLAFDAALTLALSLLLLPALLAWRVAYPARSRAERDPAFHGLSFTPRTIVARDGTPLSAWELPGAPDRPLVIYVHGYGADRGQWLPLAAALARRGFGGLLYDARGHGESGDGACTFGAKESDDVVDVARDLALAHPRASLAVVGVSMGAASALLAAAREPRIAAVAAEAPYDRLDATLRHHLRLYSWLPAWPTAPLMLRWTEALGGYDADLVAPVEAAARLPHTTRLLVIGARDDPRMPPAVVGAVHAAAGGAASLWMSGRGGHAGVYWADRAAYEARLAEFLEGTPAPAARRP